MCQKVLFTVATRGGDGCLLKAYGFDEAVDKLTSSGVDVTLKVCPEPKTSLAEVYNGVLNDAKNAGDFNWVVFIHDDACVDTVSFVNKLISLEEKYDVVGVAGAKRLNLSPSPLSWFTASRRDPAGRIGAVSHAPGVGSLQPGTTTVYTPEEFGDRDDYVAAVDGVCIAVGARAINNESCRFDERFPFDFYDMDFSFTVNKLGLKLGAVTERSFVHLSPGLGITKQKYLEVERTFREKWTCA